MEREIYLPAVFCTGITHELDVEQAGKIDPMPPAQVVAQYGPRLQKTLRRRRVHTRPI